MMSEKVQLLGVGLYEHIPNELTLHPLPTVSELDYVGSEDFDKTMIEKILPQAIEEDIDCGELLEIDYYWVCRCLRLFNYGPYFDTNAIFCSKCNTRSNGEYQVNLNTVECKPLPPGFKNEIKISKDELIDFDGEIIMNLPTIKLIQTAYNDKGFKKSDGTIDQEMARICYMIESIDGNKALIPVEIKKYIENNLSSADYIALRDIVNEKMDYGLRVSGAVQCPKCGNTDARYIAMQDDRFFRPSVGNLRAWKRDKRAGETKDTPRSKAEIIRKHN